MGPEVDKNKQKVEASTSVVTAPPTALSAELASMLVTDAGAGLENVRTEDLAVPFLQIIQKTSPQVDEANGKFIEGAKIGQLLETATNAVYDTAQFIPCDYQTLMVEWVPRETGGGFVGQHQPGYEQKFDRNDRGQWVTDNGNLIIQTMYFYGLLLQESGETMPAILGFTSSQLKKARTWVTQLTSRKVTDPASGKKFTPPIYERIWNISTVPESNDKGSWRGYKIDVAKSIDDVGLFKAARDAKIMFANSRNKIVQPGDNLPEEA